MTDKELKKLSRVELLEMLVEISRENEALQSKLIEQNEQHQAEIEKINADFQAQIDDLNRQLDDKKLAIGRAGSIAEACLQVNGIFEAAQAAAEQYLINVRNQEDLCRELERATDANVAEKLANADVEAQKRLEDAKSQAAVMIANAQVQSERILADTQAKTASYWDSVSQRLAGFYKDNQMLKNILNTNSGSENQ